METFASNARTIPGEQFLQALTGSGLLSPAEVQLLVGKMPPAHQNDARRLAMELVSQLKLTRYQAARLLQGKSVTLGGCLIQDELGKGGMGVVYKAHHRGLERQVAIKALLPELTRKEAALKRFRREVRAVSKLHHVNIVAALDAGEDRGIHYLIMEYVEGCDLAQHVKKHGVLPIPRAVDAVLQAARGLACAHEAGIVHRDIKPSNLMLDERGTVKVLDLGLARIAQVGTTSGNETCLDQLTKTGSMMGTSDYMAPEQALNIKAADHRADIYSLGCTLYWLLAGKSMYAGDTDMEKVFAHQEKPIPRLPGASRALQAVFQRMVAKDPEDRYPSMSDVVEALQACAVTRRRPGWIAGAAAAAVLALAVGYHFMTSSTAVPVTVPAERMAYRPTSTVPEALRIIQRPAQTAKDADVFIWKTAPAKEGPRDVVAEKEKVKERLREPDRSRGLLEKQVKELERQQMEKRKEGKGAEPPGAGGSNPR